MSKHDNSIGVCVRGTGRVEAFSLHPAGGWFDTDGVDIGRDDTIVLMDIGDRRFAVRYDPDARSGRRPAPALMEGDRILRYGDVDIMGYDGRRLRDITYEDVRYLVNDRLRAKAVTDSVGRYTTYCLCDCTVVRATAGIWTRIRDALVPPNHL